MKLYIACLHVVSHEAVGIANEDDGTILCSTCDDLVQISNWESVKDSLTTICESHWHSLLAHSKREN